MRTFLLCIYALLLCCSVTGCPMFERPYGFVSDEQEIELGSSFTFQCTLFNTTTQEYGVTSEQLILKFGDEVLTNTTLVDEFTVEYSVQQASLDQGGWYSCLVPIPEVPYPQMVCSSEMRVGFKPLEVTEFSCISQEFKVLNCSWKPPYNPVYTSYKLLDFISIGDVPLSQPRLPCPISKKNSCVWTLQTKPVYITDQKYLNFALIGNNSLGSKRQNIRINHYEIVKPGIPKSVTTSSVAETSLILTVAPPNRLENGEYENGIFYSLKYHSTSPQSKFQKGEMVLLSNRSAIFHIKDLIPYTSYKFAVRCHLNVESDRFYWSEEAVAVDVTKRDVPYFAPEMEKSAFHIQNIAGMRTVSLFWNAVPAAFHNAPGFYYRVKYHEHYRRSRRQSLTAGRTVVDLPDQTFYTFEDLDPGTAYQFTVIAANEQGESKNDTAVIFVDKEENLLQGPRDITVISYSQGHYDVSWKTHDPRMTNFTLFWCETTKVGARCDGHMEWAYLTGMTNWTLELPVDKNYQFAVTTTFDHQTSGLHWASCTAIHGVPLQVRKVELMPKNSTSLKVRWSLRCEAERALVKQYEIYYCPYQGNCSYENGKKCQVGNNTGINAWPHVTIAETTRTEHILGSLNPFTCYFAYMRVRTDGGLGENSYFMYESTMPSAPSDTPKHVHAVPLVLESKMAGIRVSFQPPSIPNGRISRYIIYYNKTSNGADYHKEIRIQDGHEDIAKGIVLDNVFFYTNYSVEVSACVEQACSKLSEPVFVSTAVSRPGPMTTPRVELLDSFVNVSWEAPLLPNGPLNYYELRIEENATNVESVYNVSGRNFYLMKRLCSAADTNETLFQVRAVNHDAGHLLFGDYSGMAKTMVCPPAVFDFYLLGIVAGISGGVIIGAAILIYMVYRGMNKAMEYKQTSILLPDALENANSSAYDKFKSGLRNNQDSGIPNDRAYDRLVAGMAGDDYVDSENHVTTESSQCHDSISSAKTHNSMDSGAEVESPPSPDSFSSDSGSIHTTTRSFRPDHADVALNPIYRFVSKDSGLEKDAARPVNSMHNFTHTSRGWIVKSRQPYHLAVQPSGDVIDCGNLIQMDKLSLSNSEPSMIDCEFGLNGSELLVSDGMPGYSKYGISRSQSNVTSRSQSSVTLPKTLYSRYSEKPNHQVYTVRVGDNPTELAAKDAKVAEKDQERRDYSKFHMRSKSMPHSKVEKLQVRAKPHSPPADALNEEDNSSVGEDEVNDSTQNCVQEAPSASLRFLAPDGLSGFDILDVLPVDFDPDLIRMATRSVSPPRPEKEEFIHIQGHLHCGGGLIEHMTPFAEQYMRGGEIDLNATDLDDGSVKSPPVTEERPARVANGSTPGYCLQDVANKR